MNFCEEFNLSVRSRCAVMYVTTKEEEHPSKRRREFS